MRSNESVPPHVADRWSAPGAFRVLFVGQLIPRKRPLVAIEIVRELVAQGRNVEALFLGSGPMAQEAARSSKYLPVEFIGHIPPNDVAAMLDRAHLLLHPADDDGWGMAVVESAAAGVPVVATTGCDSATELAAFTSGVRVSDGTVGQMSEVAGHVLNLFQRQPEQSTVSLMDAVRSVCSTPMLVDRSLNALRELGAGQ